MTKKGNTKMHRPPTPTLSEQYISKTVLKILTMAFTYKAC